MLKHARGVLCAPITVSRCKELDLPHQVSDNTSVLGTPFTVTIDKLEGCSTGVSAADRAATIQALADPASTPATFGRPGHINPLYAQEKGVLRRAGHTEATIDMARLAGLYPAGALMEIMNEDGTMARLPELRRMADEFGLKLISIRDLIVLYIGTNCSDTLKQSVQTHVNTLFRRLGTMCYASILLCFLYSSITCFLLCNICQRYTRHVVMK